LEKQLLVLIIVRALSRERNSSKFLRDIRFNSFEFFLRHRPSFPFFNENDRAGSFAGALCADRRAFSASTSAATLNDNPQ
jgi:hypothetical protein